VRPDDDSPHPDPTESNTVQIPKDKIREMLQQQGKSDQVDQAKQELPDRVDPEHHSELLQEFGLNPLELVSKLGGDIPGL
jgi:hypothetical protein